LLRSIQTEPSIEPVTLEEAKAHLVVEHSEDDALIDSMIRAARRSIEARCNRVIVRQKWRLYFDHGFGEMRLGPADVQEVEAIYYLDTDGAEQTLATSVYTVDIPRQCVYLAYGQSWPGTRYVRNAIYLDVWAGYYKTTSSPIEVKDDIPEDIVTCMLLMVDDLYSNRGKHSEMVLHHNDTYDALLQPHVVYEDR